MENALLGRAGFDVATTGKRPVVTEGLQSLKKLLRMVKLTILLIALTCVQARASGQTISLSLKDATLEQAFAAIERQSDYHFIYTKEELSTARLISIDVKNAELLLVLNECFASQPVGYKIEDKYIVVKQKASGNSFNKVKELKRLRGKVVNEEGLAIGGATVRVLPGTFATATDEDGRFEIEYEGETAKLRISSVGYETSEVSVTGKTYIDIILKQVINSLDETIVTAYGYTTKRVNTGNIGKLRSKEILMQPVSNPLAALDGRIAGLLVTQSNGVPGSAIKVQLRGQNSIAQGSEPLFIIDGVPFAPNNQAVTQLSSLLTSGPNSGLSPFNSLNISEIESIEVLKDADATAIYGSRGANGVILITTRKGKEGKPKLTISNNIGYSKVARDVSMLGTKEYLQMRREAFINDGISPDNLNAYDLLVWDTTRYTDFRKLLTGGTAKTNNVQGSLSGGTAETKFLISAGFRKETTVFPGNLNDSKGLFNANLNHQSSDRKFSLNLSTGYVYDRNKLTAAGITTLINLPPNLPALYDSEGNLNWEGNGYGFTNPLSYLKTSYTATTSNLLVNLQANYLLMKGLTLGASVGYNSMNVDEQLLTPISSQDPNKVPTGSSRFAKIDFRSWIGEPQLNYKFAVSKFKIGLLAGGTFQSNHQTNFSISGTGYTNDGLLSSIASAPFIDSRTNGVNDYRYLALFGRANLNYDEKYLINLSGRRDGSSRFGPGKQFANFLSVGGAWIFSKEKWFLNNLSFLSFGKIRGSYGTTGNDQIGNNKYLDVWSVGQPYQSSLALYPRSLYNSSYGWELNKKLEAGVELGFFKDRVSINASRYRNRSSNQLVEYALPTQTGFFSVLSNFPALVQNDGWEVELMTVNKKNNHFEWSSNFSLSIPRNKLVSFPGISSSAYSNVYVEGEPLSLIYKLHVTGVNSATGVFEFEDYDKNNVISVPGDYRMNGFLAPQFFGGLGNLMRYKNWQLSLFIVFRKQKGINYLNNLYQSGILPGGMNNQPVYVLDRWRQPGDQTAIQRFTTSTNNPAYQAALLFRSSDGLYSDASFVRLKNISLEWRVPTKSLKKFKLQQAAIYFRGQNLITVTNYKGSDPETQNLYALPPLKTFDFGIQLTF
jgi:TonB-linked SusC/RagA family outer membrane protein